MIELGSTMTLEAWDVKYKGNLTWNHAWGAAPANIVPRFLMGVRPLTPGYERILVQPQPARQLLPAHRAVRLEQLQEREQAGGGVVHQGVTAPSRRARPRPR